MKELPSGRFRHSILGTNTCIVVMCMSPSDGGTLNRERINKKELTWSEFLDEHNYFKGLESSWRCGGQILLVIGLSRGVLLGLLVLLGLECKSLLGVGSLLACMRALEETI